MAAMLSSSSRSALRLDMAATSSRMLDDSGGGMLPGSRCGSALAASGAVRPLTSYAEARAPEGWPRAWARSFHEGITWDLDVYGLPFHDGPLLLFTRPSLGEPAPRTWGELLAQAARLHTGGLAGTVLAGAPDGHNNVYDYVLHLWRHGGDLLTAGRLTLDTPEARATLGFLREVATTLVPGDAHELDSNGSGAAFADGRVAVTVNWAGYAALAAAAGTDFDCAVAPTHDDGTPTTTVNAFWVACVSTTCTEPDRARDYLRHAASAEMDLATTRAGASGVRSTNRFAAVNSPTTASRWRSASAAPTPPARDCPPQVAARPLRSQRPQRTSSMLAPASASALACTMLLASRVARRANPESMVASRSGAPRASTSSSSAVRVPPPASSSRRSARRSRRMARVSSPPSGPVAKAVASAGSSGSTPSATAAASMSERDAVSSRGRVGEKPVTSVTWRRR